MEQSRKKCGHGLVKFSRSGIIENVVTLCFVFQRTKVIFGRWSAHGATPISYRHQMFVLLVSALRGFFFFHPARRRFAFLRLRVSLIIQPQEERQLLWERKNRQRTHRDDKHKRARDDFRQKILQSANSRQSSASGQGRISVEGSFVELFKTGSQLDRHQKDPPFNEVTVAVELGEDLMKPGNGRGASVKALVGKSMLEQVGTDCVIYGAGVAYESNGFEVKMAKQFNCAAVLKF